MVQPQIPFPEARRHSFSKFGSSFFHTTDINYTWTIHNFSLWPSEVGSALKSPTFTGGDKGQYAWEIIAYPNGANDEDKGFLSLHLCYLAEEQSEKKATYQIDASCIKEVEGTSFLRNEPAVFSKFVNRTRLLEGKHSLRNDILTIVCHIIIIEDVVHTVEKPIFKVCETLALECYRDDMGTLYKTNKFCDVTLVTGDREIQAHKVILAARSPMFADILDGDGEEKQRVEMESIDYDVLIELLRYIYTGKTRNIDRMAEGLLIAAHVYRLDELKAQCEVTLCSNMTAENVVHLLMLSDPHNAFHLKTEALEFLCDNATDVFQTADYQTMLTSHPDLVRDVLEALAHKIG